MNINNLVRENIKSLKPYSSARDEFKEFKTDMVFLDANENPFENGVNRYPDPQQNDLKAELSKLKRIPTNQILLGNGSDEVIDLAFRIFCRPGIDKALIFSPTYGMYDVSASINNVALIKLPLNKDFQLDLEKIKPYLSDNNIKLIFICSPNNPTGNLINKADIEFILNNFNGIVMIDEAYIDFAKNDSLINLINQYNNLVVSQTFSKAWGLAAARIGVAYSNEEIISQIEDMKERIEAFLYVVKWVHALCEDRDDWEELINIMHWVNRINMYTWEKLEDCDLWEKMIHEHPNNAAAYQAQNFG